MERVKRVDHAIPGTTLKTIQKREKLNTISIVDTKGNGGANHIYDIDTSRNLFPITTIAFQNGPRNEKDSTPGILDVDLLEIVRHRLQCFQAGPFACRENAVALTKIEEALMWLNRRVEDRIEREVLGKNEK